MDFPEALDSFLIPYNPYRGGNNPNRDYDSQTLLYLKMGGVWNQQRRDEFVGRICGWLQELLGPMNTPQDRIVVLTVAPGHSPFSLPSFMHDIIGNVLAMTPPPHPYLEDGRYQLIRTIEVTKQATSLAPRTKETHRYSIAVNGEGDISTLNQGKIVFILDDIWTSGCTLSVCKEKIIATGAADVKLLAIGKTVSM